MFTRRDAFAAASLLLCSRAGAQQPPRPPVYQHDLPNLTMDDWQVTVSEINVPPGQTGRAHRHPGFVLVYVLEGAMVTKISGQAETTYKAGQMFFRTARQHARSVAQCQRYATSQIPRVHFCEEGFAVNDARVALVKTATWRVS